MSRLSLSRPGDAAGPPPPRVNSVREGSDADCRALVTCKMSSAYEKTRFSKGTDTIFPSRLDTTHLSFDLSSPARSRPEVPINAQAPPPPCPISPLRDLRCCAQAPHLFAHARRCTAACCCCPSLACLHAAAPSRPAQPSLLSLHSLHPNNKSTQDTPSSSVFSSVHSFSAPPPTRLVPRIFMYSNSAIIISSISCSGLHITGYLLSSILLIIVVLLILWNTLPPAIERRVAVA